MITMSFHNAGLVLDPESSADEPMLNKLADFLATLEAIVVDETDASVPRHVGTLDGKGLGQNTDQ